MSFDDSGWINAQRDDAIFPAYTDYLFGNDERLKVLNEPGLHPMVVPLPLLAPIPYTNNMPPRSACYKAMEEAGLDDNGTQTLDLRMPSLPAAMVKLIPSETVRPKPAVSSKPTRGPQYGNENGTVQITHGSASHSALSEPVQITLLRPGELMNDSRYAFVPHVNLQHMNNQICYFWDVVQNHSHEELRRQAIAQLQVASVNIYRMMQEWQRGAHILSRNHDQHVGPSPNVVHHQVISSQGNHLASRLANAAPSSPDPIRQPLLSNAALLNDTDQPQFQAPLATLRQQKFTVSNPETGYPGSPQEQYQQQHDLSTMPPNLRTYIDAHIPNLISASRVVATPCESDNMHVLEARQKAQAWINMFKAGLPPVGHAYLEEVCMKMMKERDRLANGEIKHESVGIKEERA